MERELCVFFEKAVKLSFNILIYGALEDEVFLCHGPMKMSDLANPVLLGDVVVGFDLKTMRANLKLPKGGSGELASSAEACRGAEQEGHLSTPGSAVHRRLSWGLAPLKDQPK
jgi:hypothetical protein